jgi:hypothetical protein
MLPGRSRTRRTASNDAYTFHPGAGSFSYVANGLNQYATVNGAAYGYDGRGNLASDGARTFTYDVNNVPCGESRLASGARPIADCPYAAVGLQDWAGKRWPRDRCV